MQATETTESVRTFYETDDRSLVSPDGRATLIPISLVEPGEDHIEERLEVVEQADAATDLDVAITVCSLNSRQPAGTRRVHQTGHARALAGISDTRQSVHLQEKRARECPDVPAGTAPEPPW